MHSLAHTPWPLPSRRGLRLALAAAAVAMMLVAAVIGGLALVGGGRLTRPGAPSAAGAPPRLILALHDGSVVERAGGAERVLLPPWTTRPTVDAVSPGEGLGSREIAYDARRSMLWYADTHGAIHSLHVDTGAPGPDLLGFADLSVPGCAITSNARAMAVDPVHDRLLVPTLTGAVLFYDLRTLPLSGGQPVGGLMTTFFGDVVLGGFRHFAVDPVTGLAWYATSAGDLVEADLMHARKTGRVVPLAQQDHGVPAGAREIGVDPTGSRLVYRTLDNRLAAVDLRTLQPAPAVADEPVPGVGAFALTR